MVAALAIAAGGYLLLMVAASSSDSSRLATPCTNDATAEAVRADNDIRTGRIISPDSEVECRARRALLTPEDIGPEWQYSEVTSTGRLLDNADSVYPSTGGYACRVPLVGARGGIDRAFEAGEPEKTGIDLIAQSVVLFEAGSASDYLNAIRISCEKRARAFPGEGAERPIDVGTVGDEVVAFEFEEFDTPNYIALVRRGDAIVTLYYVSDEPSLETFNRAVRAADQQLHNVESALTAPHNPDYYIPPTPQPGTLDEVLLSGLLTLDDFDPGWVKSSRLRVDDGKGFCDEPLISEDRRPPPVGEATALFVSSQEAVGQSVRQYASGEAEEYMELIQESAASEPDCVYSLAYDFGEDADARELIYDVEVRPLDLALEGDHLVAMRTRYELRDGDRQEVSDHIYLWRDDFILAVAFHHQALVPSPGRYDPPTEQIERLGELLDEKSMQLQDALSAYEAAQ